MSQLWNLNEAMVAGRRLINTLRRMTAGYEVHLNGHCHSVVSISGTPSDESSG